MLVATIATAGLGLLVVAPAAQAIPTSYTTSYTQYTQDTSYDCGPYASKIVLTTFGIGSSIATLSAKEGTDTNGTDSASNIATGLNYYLAAHGALIRFSSHNPSSVSDLQRYVTGDIYGDNGFVANVVGYQLDVNGTRRGYGSGGHYVAVVGYRSSGAQALIADPGNGQHYYMTTSNLYNWIGSARSIAVTPA